MDRWMTDDRWAALQKLLHPDAYSEVCAAVEAEEIQPREYEVIDRAVAAHARVTGVHLTIHF